MTYTLADIRTHAAKNAEKNPEWAPVVNWSDDELKARLGKTSKIGTAITSVRWYLRNPTVDPLAPNAEPKAKPEPKAAKG